MVHTTKGTLGFSGWVLWIKFSTLDVSFCSQQISKIRMNREKRMSLKTKVTKGPNLFKSWVFLIFFPPTCVLFVPPGLFLIWGTTVVVLHLLRMERLGCNQPENGVNTRVIAINVSWDRHPLMLYIYNYIYRDILCADIYILIYIYICIYHNIIIMYIYIYISFKHI